ncbi:MAG TPA: ABC transporter ATP-binding protein [Opitutaceae bacterium]|jgi:ABC-2 type transport system ATP-binding protein
MPASISVRNLTRSYGAVLALRGVSLEVAPGEVVGLLGPNGAGKTTAIECILGLRAPDGGTVLLDGVDVLARPSEARSRCGAQLQGAALQDKLSPRRALAFFSGFYRDALPVPALLSQFGLEQKADAPFQSLSAGQRQRLALALAFVNNPRVVLLDEPTAGLDPKSRREIHGLVAGMRGSGRAVLMSTHDLDEAARLCDRVAILDEGRIVAEARPADLARASSAHAAVRVRASVPLDPSALGSLAGVTAAARDGEAWLVSTSQPGLTVQGLAAHVAASGGELVELAIVQPSLEDAFLSLTGRGDKGGGRRAPP